MLLHFKCAANSSNSSKYVRSDSVTPYANPWKSSEPSLFAAGLNHDSKRALLALNVINSNATSGSCAFSTPGTNFQSRQRRLNAQAWRRGISVTGTFRDDLRCHAPKHSVSPGDTVRTYSSRTLRNTDNAGGTRPVRRRSVFAT